MTKEEKREYNRKYRENNKEYYKQYKKEWQQTPKGRANCLLQAYKRNDQKYGRENNLTAHWIVERIFSQPCHYCGESDWKKIGCDRIDNTIGHIKSNVVSCCYKCNKERQKMNFEDFCKKNEKNK